jgi:hypothetical protein
LLIVVIRVQCNAQPLKQHFESIAHSGSVRHVDVHDDIDECERGTRDSHVPGRVADSGLAQQNPRPL